MSERNISTLRDTLFEQLESVSKIDRTYSAAEAKQILSKAETMVNISNAIIETVKVEQQQMKLAERARPFTQFIPDQIGQSIHTSEHAAQLAAHSAKMWKDKNNDRIEEANRKQS